MGYDDDESGPLLSYDMDLVHDGAVRQQDVLFLVGCGACAVIQSSLLQSKDCS